MVLVSALFCSLFLSGPHSCLITGIFGHLLIWLMCQVNFGVPFTIYSTHVQQRLYAAIIKKLHSIFVHIKLHCIKCVVKELNENCCPKTVFLFLCLWQMPRWKLKSSLISLANCLPLILQDPEQCTFRNYWWHQLQFLWSNRSLWSVTQHLSAENISDFCHGDLPCGPGKPYLRSKCTGLLQSLTQQMAQHVGDHLIGLHLLVFCSDSPYNCRRNRELHLTGDSKTILY